MSPRKIGPRAPKRGRLPDPGPTWRSMRRLSPVAGSPLARLRAALRRAKGAGK